MSYAILKRTFIIIFRLHQSFNLSDIFIPSFSNVVYHLSSTMHYILRIRSRHYNVRHNDLERNRRSNQHCSTSLFEMSNTFHINARIDNDL